jgi:hypothetical protein
VAPAHQRAGDFEDAALHDVEAVPRVALPEQHVAGAELLDPALGQDRPDDLVGLVLEDPNA